MVFTVISHRFDVCLINLNRFRLRAYSEEVPLVVSGEKMCTYAVFALREFYTALSGWWVGTCKSQEVRQLPILRNQIRAIRTGRDAFESSRVGLHEYTQLDCGRRDARTRDVPILHAYT